MSDEELDPDDLALDLSEFADGPEEELARLKDKSSEKYIFEQYLQLRQLVYKATSPDNKCTS